MKKFGDGRFGPYGGQFVPETLMTALAEVEEAMNKYGSDKPDLRFDLKLEDVTEICKKSNFNVFKEAECVKCIKVKGDFCKNC